MVKMVSIYEIFNIFHKVRILFFGFILFFDAHLIAGVQGKSPIHFLSLHGVPSQESLFSACLASVIPGNWLVLMLVVINSILLVIYLFAAKSFQFAREKFMLEGIINKRTEELLDQKEKVDDLLSNMLPKVTADQLKKTGRARTQKYSMVSILFSDIEGFTRIAEQMNPEILVDELDKFFFKFDSLVEEFNIEKIKTIGDAYMAAGGIPERNRTNPVDVVLAAMSIMQYMKQLKTDNQYFWDLRIGIHTGPIIAGVVGQKKLSYDIWGDSVNIASRMESSGEAGRINISGSTWEFVKDFFVCEYRGKMPVKYKGNIDMYFIKGFRPELSKDMLGKEPGDGFFIKLQQLRFKDIEEEFLKKMEDELPAILQFHNIKYCIELLSTCELLLTSEKIPDQDRLIVRTAALFECLSYSKGYMERKKYIYQLSRELLPRYHYTELQCKKIYNLLRLPFMPPAAKSIPEKIFSDARLAFLGKSNFLDYANALYLELKYYGQTESRSEFFRELGEFSKSFEFYTRTAGKLGEVPVSSHNLEITS
jgi:adenylate cyclase